MIQQNLFVQNKDSGILKSISTGVGGSEDTAVRSVSQEMEETNLENDELWESVRRARSLLDKGFFSMARQILAEVELGKTSSLRIEDGGKAV